MKEKLKRAWWKFWPCTTCATGFFQECKDPERPYRPRHAAIMTVNESRLIAGYQDSVERRIESITGGYRV